MLRLWLDCDTFFTVYTTCIQEILFGRFISADTFNVSAHSQVNVIMHMAAHHIYVSLYVHHAGTRHIHGAIHCVHDHGAITEAIQWSNLACNWYMVADQPNKRFLLLPVGSLPVHSSHLMSGKCAWRSLHCNNFYCNSTLCSIGCCSSHFSH